MLIGRSSALHYPVPLKRRPISNVMQMQTGLSKLPPTLIIIIICIKWCFGTQRRAVLVLLGCLSLLRLPLQSSNRSQKPDVSNWRETSPLQPVPAKPPAR